MTPINSRHTASRNGLDDVFSALSHTLRRRVLLALMDDNPRRKDEFETVEFRPPEGDERVEIQLRHSHLPKLDEAGFIDWEPRTGRISRGEHFEDVRPLLELLDEHRDELPDDWP